MGTQRARARVGPPPWLLVMGRTCREGARRVRGAWSGVQTARLRSVLALCMLALCELAPCLCCVYLLRVDRANGQSAMHACVMRTCATVLVLRVPAACDLAVRVCAVHLRAGHVPVQQSSRSCALRSSTSSTLRVVRLDRTLVRDRDY